MGYYIAKHTAEQRGIYIYGYKLPSQGNTLKWHI